MEESEKIRVYHWKYDDGSKGYAVRRVRNDEKEWLSVDYCANKSEFKRACADIRRKFSSMDIEFKKYHLVGGLNNVCSSNFPESDANRSADGIDAMKQLLDSGGTMQCRNAFLNLVSAILSGYCARVCSDYYKVERIQDKYKYAPVVSVSHADCAYYVLERIADSFAVNTSAVNPGKYKYLLKLLWSKYHVSLPLKQSDRSITDCIYLKLAKKRFRIKPQLRDTTILVHCRFFPGSEIADLQRRNIWTSLVLYDAPKAKLLPTPVHIDGKFLALSNCLWDIEDLNFIIQRYVSYLARKSGSGKWGRRIKKYFQEAEQLIAQHNNSPNSTPIKRAQKYQLSLQMLALRLLLDSCKADRSLTKEEANDLLAAWYQVMLPGCSLEKVQETCEQDDQDDWDAPEPFQAQFEEVICKILEADDFAHICFSKNNICPGEKNTSDGRIEYWAYVSLYSPKGKPEFWALRLRRKTFERLFQTYCENYSGEDVFKDFRSLDAEYIEGNEGKKARMYFSEDDKKGKNPTDALILNIDRMSFLPQETADRLRKIINDNESSGSAKKEKSSGKKTSKKTEQNSTKQQNSGMTE